MCESDGWPGRLRTKKSEATTMSILRGQGEYMIMHRCRGTAAWLTFLTGENACRNEYIEGMSGEGRIDRVGLQRVFSPRQDIPDLCASRRHFCASSVLGRSFTCRRSWRLFHVPKLPTPNFAISNATTLPKIDMARSHPLFSSLFSIPPWN